MRLSVVVPCFNESANIESVVTDAVTTLSLFLTHWELVVVDDGSIDDTPAVLKRLATEHKAVRVVRHACNRGYGAALNTGFQASRFESVAFTDGDGQFRLIDLRALVDAARGEHCVVAGYRVRRSDSFARRALGRTWTAMCGWVLGVRVRDLNCALKLFPRALVDEPLVASGASVNAELLQRAVLRGFEVREVAVMHFPRVRGVATGARMSVVVGALVELGRLGWARVSQQRGRARRVWRRRGVCLPP